MLLAMRSNAATRTTLNFRFPGVLHHGVESRTPGFRAGDAHIGVFANHLKATLFRKLPQVAQLGFYMLFRG